MWLSQVRRVLGDDKTCDATLPMHKAQCWNPPQQLPTPSNYYFRRSRLTDMPHLRRVFLHALYTVSISKK